MIQFNLLPDVKLNYIRARQRKRLITVIATTLMGLSLTVLLLLFIVVIGVQRRHLQALSKDIDTDVKKLQNTPNLDKILTVQNQLMSLRGLHDDKPVGSRLFTYLGQVTTAQLSIARLEVNFEQKTMKFTGSSTLASDINTFVDTLKFTTFVTDETSTEEGTKAFSNVVLSSYSLTDTGANYIVDLVYDEAIFDSEHQNLKLVVPNTITTRSETEKPLFQPVPVEEED